MDYGRTKEVIRSSTMMLDEDIAFIDSNIDAIQAVFAKRQKYRTETEMRISVLNEMKFPTPAAKYWQCVRELGSFYGYLVDDAFSYRRNAIEIEILRRSLTSEEDELQRGLIQIDIEQQEFRQLALESGAKDRMREIRMWMQLMEECIEADDSFDTEDVNTHQLKSYHARFINQAKELSEFTPVSERINLLGQLASATAEIEGKAVIGPNHRLETGLNITYRLGSVG